MTQLINKLVRHLKGIVAAFEEYQSSQSTISKPGTTFTDQAEKGRVATEE